MEQVQMNMQGDPSCLTVVFVAAELDILRLLNVSGASPGVSEVLGPSAHLPAYKFRPGYNNVLVPDPGAIAAALTAPAGFTLLFVYRQHRKTLGEHCIKHVQLSVIRWGCCEPRNTLNPGSTSLLPF
jgi:hypothetical protein